MKLADFVTSLLVEADKMRSQGLTLDQVSEGLKGSLLDYARERGMVHRERDLPPYFFKSCGACQDTGWERTTRLWRGDSIEAYKRCTCRPNPTDRSPREALDSAMDKVTKGWSKAGRR